MIETLTPKQEEQLNEYREKMFNRALSTKTNRSKAEKWALRLTDGVVDNPEIHWCQSPEEAKKKFGNLGGILGDRLPNTLTDILEGCLADSITPSPYTMMMDSLEVCLVHRLMRVSSLAYSLVDCLGDTAWIAFYSFGEKLGVKYSQEDRRKLKCYRKLLKHCFALYVLPGHIILVEKPIRVEVQEGELVDIEFGK